MAGEIALDTSIAIRYLNGDQTIIENSWILTTNDEHFTYVDGLTVERW